MVNDEPSSYHLPAIRELLRAAFTPDTLRRFCQDDPTFRPVYDEFGPGQGLAEMVDRVIAFGETRLLFDDLLARVREEYPGQYERFRPRLYDSQPLAERGAYFHLPFPRNPGFVGREQDLARLHELAAARPTVLVGLGGCGKTQLVVEYAYLYRAEYPEGVYWLNAIKPLGGELAALARKLGLARVDTPDEQAARVAWSYLDSCPRALAIFDNVEEPSRLAEPLGPGMMAHHLHCHALFTTRQWDLPFGFEMLEVGMLPEQAALRLLLAGRPAVRDDERHPEWAWARVACFYLGRLPLALALAGAYLKNYPEVMVRDYVQGLRAEGALALIDDSEVRFADLPTHIYELAKAQALDAGLSERSYVAVTATLRTQWSRLDPVGDDAARRLFRAAGQFPGANWIPAAWLGLLAGVETTARPGRVSAASRAWRKLQAISMVEGPAQGRVYLHPLVHDFARQLTPEAEVSSYRLELEDHLIAALQAAGCPAETVLAAGECLIALPWPASRMRAAVVGALRAAMTREEEAEDARRRAAWMLEQLRWLDDAQAVSRAEMLAYLRFAERLIYRRQDWSDLAARIVPLLAGASSDRQRAHLHAHRATFLARLAPPEGMEEARQEYDLARQALDRLAPADRVPEDDPLDARIKLGQANIVVCQEMLRREEGGQQDDAELEKAVALYREAAAQTGGTGAEVALAVGIYAELSRTLGLLGSWDEAEAWYGRALDELDNEPNPEAWVDRYALILRNASLMHWAKGNHLAAQERLAEARAAFEVAYHYAEAEVAILAKLREPLYLAEGWINVGDYLQAMSEVDQAAAAGLMAEACDAWRAAQATAQGWGLEGLDEQARAEWMVSLDETYRQALAEIALAADERLAGLYSGGCQE